jgi:hypothetical protein
MADDHNQLNRGEGYPHKWRSWAEIWPKVKTPLQLILGQVIGWALRKWLG